MPGLEIHPLSELRDEAARLLAERFARQRAAEPLLHEIEDFAAHVPDEDGLVATRGGRAVAYLAGSLRDDTAWVGFAGCAASEAEALRDVFAALAPRWGVSRFQVAVPASEEPSIDAFFRLAFGCQAVWAVRETDAPVPVQVQETHVRPSTADDLDLSIELEQLLYAHQGEAPSFSGLSVPTREELLPEHQNAWDDERTHLFAAERDSEAVGLLLLYRRPEGDLRVPAGNIDLAFAATREASQGRGVGLALAAHAFAWAREHGFRSMTVDWRSPNLLSSRFWPKRGFRPQYFRLCRAIP